MCSVVNKICNHIYRPFYYQYELPDVMLYLLDREQAMEIEAPVSSTTVFMKLILVESSPAYWSS
jgi:hypothetical protein